MKDETRTKAELQADLKELRRQLARLEAAGARPEAEEEPVRLARAIDQMPEVVMITDPDWTIRYVNSAVEESGYTRRECLGQRPPFFAADKVGDEVLEAIAEAVTGGTAWKGQLTHRKKDGTSYEAEATISPIRDGSGAVTSFLAVSRDISHEIQLERQLRQAQKMEAIGTLAGGIAHDFNNILASIIGLFPPAPADPSRPPPLTDPARSLSKGLARPTLLPSLLQKPSSLLPASLSLPSALARARRGRPAPACPGLRNSYILQRSFQKAINDKALTFLPNSRRRGIQLHYVTVWSRDLRRAPSPKNSIITREYRRTSRRGTVVDLSLGQRAEA